MTNQDNGQEPVSFSRVLLCQYGGTLEQPVSHRHSTSLDRIALGPLRMDAKYDITLAIYLLCNQRWA